MSASDALAHIRALAGEKGSARVDLEDVCDRALLTVTFHSDRPDTRGRTTAPGLAADGGYRTQFETGRSSLVRLDPPAAAPGRAGAVHLQLGRQRHPTHRTTVYGEVIVCDRHRGRCRSHTFSAE